MRVGDPLRQYRDDRVAADVGPSPGDLAPGVEGDAVGFRVAPREPGFPRIGLVGVIGVGLRPWRIRCRSPGRSARSRRRACRAGARTAPPCGSRRAATGCRECGRRRSHSCGRSHKASFPHHGHVAVCLEADLDERNRIGRSGGKEPFERIDQAPRIHGFAADASPAPRGCPVGCPGSNGHHISAMTLELTATAANGDDITAVLADFAGAILASIG